MLGLSLTIKAIGGKEEEKEERRRGGGEGEGGESIYNTVQLLCYSLSLSVDSQ